MNYRLILRNHRKDILELDLRTPELPQKGEILRVTKEFIRDYLTSTPRYNASLSIEGKKDLIKKFGNKKYKVTERERELRRLEESLYIHTTPIKD